MMILLIFSLIPLGIFLYRGIQIVPQQEVWVVERLGKFSRLLDPGPNWVVPFIDSIVDRHSLKEEAIHVPEQTAVTQDNVSVILDGFVYIKIEDPFNASYGVKDPAIALIQLAQTTMRSEIGKIPLDKTFEERESLNAQLVEAINHASTAWGIKCLRYEVKDIKMPEEIRKAMELQMTAERQKRARILESEGMRQADINQSEGQKQAQVNRASGEAEAMELISEATSRSIEKVARALGETGGERAAALQIAEKYLEAFRQLAKEGNTIVLPSNIQHPGTMITEALAIYDQIKRKPSLTETLAPKISN